MTASSARSLAARRLSASGFGRLSDCSPTRVDGGVNWRCRDRRGLKGERADRCNRSSRGQPWRRYFNAGASLQGMEDRRGRGKAATSPVTASPDSGRRAACHVWWSPGQAGVTERLRSLPTRDGPMCNMHHICHTSPRASARGWSGAAGQRCAHGDPQRWLGASHGLVAGHRVDAARPVELLRRWAALVGTGPWPTSHGAALLDRWAEPHRRYHDLAHLAVRARSGR